MDQVTYDSSLQRGYLQIHALYYNAIAPTRICFPREGVDATVNSLGHIEIFAPEGNSLSSVDVPVHPHSWEYGHSAQYGDVWVKADGALITFELPVYDWEDNYPHCDGESDRWDRYQIGVFHVVFDLAAKTITLPDRESIPDFWRV